MTIPGSTYAGQSSLPRLPIPTLEETLDRFPAMVAALLTKKEMIQCHEEVQKFRTTDGPKLQKLLMDYEQSGKVGSFVEEFWTDAYLAPDSSVVMNLNPFFVLEDGPDTKKSNCQSRRAASLCFSAIKFASSLKNEAIVPDSFRGKPLCMDQFRALFGACRIPELIEKDKVVVNTESCHVVVLENNQFYFFQALWEDGSVAVDEDDILEILTAIKLDASQVSPEISSKNAIGVLTTLSRREWAVARDSIVSHSTTNETALEIVDGALFVLVIDNVIPKSIHEAAANMLHGTYCLRSDANLVDYQAGSCCNRWYDKLQIIVCQDGRAGINFEHSAVDGHTALRLVSDIFADNVIQFAQTITKTIYSDTLFPSLIHAKIRKATAENSSLVLPRKLNFELPKTVLDRIHFAETAMGDEIVASDTFVLEFNSFGKNLIVRNNLSPDAFVQISMQLAYFRLYGKIVSQYEPVLMKAFYHGRTEAARSSTEKVSNLCYLWLNHASTRKEKLEALRMATENVSAGVKTSASGKGLERHLFALMKIAEKNNIPTPDFFTCAAYNKLNHTVLSTSNCGNPSLRLFGFGPVVQDGFGIGYIIRDNGIQYSISSKHRQTERFAHMLKKTLIDMGDLLIPLSKVSVARDHGKSKAKMSTAEEYCDAYGDSFGESQSESFTNFKSTTPVGRRNTLMGVLQKEPSVRAFELSHFGQVLTIGSTSGEEDDTDKLQQLHVPYN